MRKKSVCCFLAAIGAAAFLTTACGASDEGKGETNSPLSQEEGTIAIIGGADGPTSIFLAGKQGEEEDRTPLEIRAIDQAAAEKTGHGEETVLDFVGELAFAGSLEGQSDLPQLLPTAVIHGPWGVAVFRAEEGEEGPFWRNVFSADLKSLDPGYMAEGSETDVIPVGVLLYIATEKEGQEPVAFLADLSDNTLYEMTKEEQALLPALREAAGKMESETALKSRGSALTELYLETEDGVLQEIVW